MKISGTIYPRILMPVSALAGYSVVFLILYRSVGPPLAALGIIPLAMAGWFLGVRGSLIFGVFQPPLNMLLFSLAGNPTFSIVSHVVGGFSFTLVGVIIGWIRMLMHKVHKQAQELREEGLVLQEEVKKRIKAEEQLSHEALHDPLTNLPNRRMFANLLNSAIEWNKRNPQDLFAVIYLDFDRFKVINDSLGHTVGDQLLIGLANRLKSSIRAVDSVSRMGGDEFAILLEAFKKDDEVFMIIKRIQENLAEPFEIGTNPIVMTASIGVVMNLQRYERLEDILRDGDIAMYSAKSSGRNRYKVFDELMREEAQDLLNLESSLRKAIDNSEFRIHYQPILSLKRQQITGFEALIRWEHPEKGLVYPDYFIKAAEDSGLIFPIGQWVLAEACRQMRQWQLQRNINPPLTISVNLSSRQFAHPDLVDQILAILVETGLPPQCLRLELSEAILIKDIKTATSKIEHFLQLGIEVEIDDFGTGNSSLGYLSHLPVKTLKIDRSFVSELGINKSEAPIIQAIIAMANALGMKVIAEGIETENQKNSLIKLECDSGQGYLFNKPLKSDDAWQLIEKSFSKQPAMHHIV